MRSVARIAKAQPLSKVKLRLATMEKQLTELKALVLDAVVANKEKRGSEGEVQGAVEAPD